MHAFKPDEV